MLIKFMLIFVVMLSFSGYVRAGDVVDDTIQSINVSDISGIQDGIRRGLDVNYADASGTTMLMLAARSGNPDAVMLLINAGARVYPTNAFGDTALLIATYGGHEKIVDILLSKGASIGANPKGWTPLHYAAFAGHPNLAKKFIKPGVNIDRMTDNGLTALMVASRNGHIEVVKILLSNKANIQLRDENDKNALAHALANKNTDIAALLTAASNKQQKFNSF